MDMKDNERQRGKKKKAFSRGSLESSKNNGKENFFQKSKVRALSRNILYLQDKRFTLCLPSGISEFLRTNDCYVTFILLFFKMRTFKNLNFILAYSQ